MCGIIGIISDSDVVSRLIEGLKRLEYRGYDSAGIAVKSNLGDMSISRSRAKGKIINLERAVEEEKPQGCIGIGHTRWATHGSPTLINAHPHISENIAVVHNGIIENFLEIRSELEKEGVKFVTQTDTEVIPNLLQKFIKQGKSPKNAMLEAVKILKGAFAIGAIFSGEDDVLLIAKQGSPLAIGYGKEEMYIASDALALSHMTKNISYLEDGDIGVLTKNDAKLYDFSGKEIERAIIEVKAEDVMVAKENYAHYMLKEIYEQPTVIANNLKSCYHPVTGKVELPQLPFKLKNITAINIVACGTSFYAGMTAKYWIEQIAQVPVNVDIASEFRYRKPILQKNGLTIVISQSGETADTLAAMRYAKQKGQHTLAIVNVRTSTMAREADAILETHAGPEIGVASTKAFTAQLMTLACFTLALAVSKKSISNIEEAELSHSLSEMSSRMVDIFHHDEMIEKLSRDLVNASHIIYIGRGLTYPLALEGALKLKEITYIPAEANAAGELKHGPIALIDDNIPIIAIAPSDELFEKTAGNINEVVARGGKVILLSDKKGISQLEDIVHTVIELPEADPFAAPILYAIPIQLIAYYVAIAKGTNVDQPRNLAKSVTVE
ncbi:MAG: glutamine--fructose-6-phosphate transaminase (isomerizing) [Rickettsiales bacterium]|nr:glutamine--fructose-6-phosphate transaminase (isomerizing) [Pseudomonadota bacterium]MDA0967301.1 glutamine--fructose-6-phosphate transaminase (isomerizing) [Pseudomonadota bacterium]MDG4544038.1 glutamine--fructose-6-phosphate transaminase (isomerizing) [Rickettsiales bacterium]MDG4546268.1 glutamine--fructose-6-phosphate transaminase (isomerizing) [Rickettsiales bacterium]MDG4548362.1 glutamine--fructose-6-phosphate transaminase (isomerizing) [Rickettsiales bacterium]